MIAGGEIFAPIDLDMIFGPHWLVIRRGPDEHQPLLEQQLGNHSGTGGRGVQDREIQRTLLHFLHQPFG